MLHAKDAKAERKGRKELIPNILLCDLCDFTLRPLREPMKEAQPND